MSGKLAAWLALISAQILLNYAARAASSGTPDRNAVYHYSLPAAGLVQYAVILGVVVAIAGVGHVRELLALRPPRSWGVAAKTSLVVIVGVVLLNYLLDPLLHPGREQGLTPTGWQSGHVGAFVASFLLLVIVGPFVEEATFRGLGYSLLAPFGELTAILTIGLLFGLAHGLVEALPILAALGAGLAWVRARTDSLYPGFAVHALFNAFALIVAVTT
jgi:membrane protease YdiL (CAAX protease family)